jgi:hypothetical protein
MSPNPVSEMTDNVSSLIYTAMMSLGLGDNAVCYLAYHCKSIYVQVDCCCRMIFTGNYSLVYLLIGALMSNKRFSNGLVMLKENVRVVYKGRINLVSFKCVL